MASITITVYTTIANACAALRGELFVGALFNTKGAFGRTKVRVPVTISTAEWTADPDDEVHSNGVVAFAPRKFPPRKLPATR